ncbi:MAG: transcription termination/antitermination protein NusA [Acidobacteria bacterium]|nr:transcription termination/antitermination protein NusA [Acidobacteriota bacterium]
MNGQLLQAIEQVGREKGIDQEIIIAAVEDAILAASRKFFKTKEELASRFNREDGTLEVFAVKRVVDRVTQPEIEISLEAARKEIDASAQVDDVIEIPKATEMLGRIAAQAAKQIIYQKVREAERDIVHKEYSGRVGELVHGAVKRFERGNIIVDLGRAEALLPKKDQSRAEHYGQGDRIRAIIIDVDRNSKGPQVIVSRTDPRLIMKLFAMEVPEIYDGTVVIESTVRDPGDRAKIAVRSKDRDVDPVGACVGMKGSRVQSIIRELRGEKIDIVQWSDQTTSLVTNALNPARINRVVAMDQENKVLEVVVDDDQLSLAIGKKGQNVRLASRLVGWRIDIKSESEKVREVEMEMERAARASREMRSLKGISETIASRLIETGYGSYEDLLETDPDALQEVPGVGPKTAEKILAAAREGFERRQAEEEAKRAEEEAARQVEEARRMAEATAAAAGEVADPETGAGTPPLPADGDPQEAPGATGAAAAADEEATASGPVPSAEASDAGPGAAAPEAKGSER